MLYRFDQFELDTGKAELRADGAPRPVEPQVFALISLLVENRERLVSRDELIEKIWEGRVVSDAAVASRIKSARRALGDDGTAQRHIRTVHKQGYRFVSTVRIAGSTASVEPAAAPATEKHSKPSIAVLPFRCIGETGRYGAVGDALPHELIIDLARLRWLFVTARGSSFRLRDDAPDMGQVGRLLGVRYCLSGSVEVAGPTLVVAVELVDTRDGGVVWAERFARVVDDVHRVRADVRSCVLAALEIQVPLHEASLARLTVTDNLDAWSAYHLGLQHMYRFTRRDNAAATALFQQAVARDPGFARAHAGLSFVHFQTAFMQHTDDVRGETDLARRFALRGLELDPLDPFVNFTMGRTFWLTGDLEGSLAWLERATSLSPNYAQGHYARAWSEALAGQPGDARVHTDLAMRLSPLDPLLYGMLGTRSFSHMMLGENTEAAAWAERAAQSPGAHVLIAMIACAAQGLAGDPVRAAYWGANARERNPALSRAHFFHAFPMRSEAVRKDVSAVLARHGFS